MKKDKTHHSLRTSLPLLICLVVAICGCSVRVPGTYEKQATRILKTTPIIDTHIDFPWSLVEHKEWFTPSYTDLALNHPVGEFDLKRAKKGGLYGAFMSIYIPAIYQKEKGRSRQVADSLILAVEQVAAAHPGKFSLAYKAADITENFKKGIVSLPMGMENGSPIEKIEDVAYFHRKGIRYVTLTHSRDNQICDSSYDTLQTNGGLSPFGKDVVREMNRVGIMVDVSHLSDKSIVDVLAIAKKPLVASHSGCRHFTPGFIRNLPDSLIVAIAKTNGVVQVPFSHYFLTTDSRKEFNDATKEMENKGLKEDTPQGRYFMNQKVRQMATSVKTVADQMDYLRKLVGIDHIGIGSDFDGVGYALPPDLADVSMYPNLLAELLARGYTESDIRKICSENLLRVWKANE
jgi:membrane dipeptidase